eukprot:185086_1
MTNTRIVCTTNAIICIVIIMCRFMIVQGGIKMCRFAHISPCTNSSLLIPLPNDIKLNILRYSTSDRDLLHYYFASYRKMNETQTEEMNNVIRSRMGNLTFDHSLSLSVFYFKTQSLDDEAKRLEQEAMQRTQKLKEKQLNRIICNQTTVQKCYYTNSMRITFSFRLQQIFTHLRDLNIDINGSVSLQQLWNGPLLQIRDLQLYENGIHSLDLFSDLTQCNALNDLNLADNELSDIDALSELNGSQLEELCLAGNKLTNIERLRGFNKLSHLYLGKNRIKDIEPLAELKALRSLCLDHNNISNIDPLRVLTKLNTLWL